MNTQNFTQQQCHENTLFRPQQDFGLYVYLPLTVDIRDSRYVIL